MTQTMVGFAQRAWMGLVLVAVAGLVAGCGYLAPAISVENEVSVMVRPEPSATYDHPVSLTAQELTILLQSVRVTFTEHWLQRLITGPLSPEPLFDQATMSRVVGELAGGLERAGPHDRIVFYVAQRRSDARRDVTSGSIFVKGGMFHLTLANYQNRVDRLPGMPEYDRNDPEVAVAPQRMMLAFDRPDFLGAREPDILDGVFGAAPPRLVIDYTRFLKVTAKAGRSSQRH